MIYTENYIDGMYDYSWITSILQKDYKVYSLSDGMYGKYYYDTRHNAYYIFKKYRVLVRSDVFYEVYHLGYDEDIHKDAVLFFDDKYKQSFIRKYGCLKSTEAKALVGISGEIQIPRSLLKSVQLKSGDRVKIFVDKDKIIIEQC